MVIESKQGLEGVQLARERRFGHRVSSMEANTLPTGDAFASILNTHLGAQCLG